MDLEENDEWASYEWASYEWRIFEWRAARRCGDEWANDELICVIFTLISVLSRWKRLLIYTKCQGLLISLGIFDLYSPPNLLHHRLFHVRINGLDGSGDEDTKENNKHSGVAYPIIVKQFAFGCFLNDEAC